MNLRPTSALCHVDGGTLTICCPHEDEVDGLVLMGHIVDDHARGVWIDDGMWLWCACHGTWPAPDWFIARHVAMLADGEEDESDARGARPR